jgi:preprotein translocase subunit SecD
MVLLPRWKIVVILLVSFLGLAYAAPNILGAETLSAWQKAVPSWLPGKTINLGLDLRGGSHLLLKVDLVEVTRSRARGLSQAIRQEARDAKVRLASINAVGDSVAVTLGDDPKALETVQKSARDFDAALEVVETDSGKVMVRLTEKGEKSLMDRVIAQTIEVVRRRVDETGTTEPIIQRQGDDRIVLQVPGEQDPARLKNLLSRTARLSFHAVDLSVGPVEQATGKIPSSVRMLPMVDKENQKLPVRIEEIVGGDSLVDSQTSFENADIGVTFRFDNAGGKRFGEATKINVGKPIAIVLDGKVISAPVVREPILGGRGVISGDYTAQEAGDLALLLRSGALPASLTVVEERSVGPSLGADSVAAGRTSSLMATVIVMVFMILGYGLFGIFAAVALGVNIALIFAIMSALQATLSLPGIAGIVLTIGMAVDSNVLVFERIRDEIRNGRTPIAAIDAGYNRALTAIVDSNLTTLISALFLFSFGAGPVRGFAVTLVIGTVTSLFSAIMLTRVFVLAWYRKTRPTQIIL